MVCKEDVLLWFKDLESYKRIDLVYELLNMCVPFELRFLGSCIEEMGKYSYQELRGPEIIANDLEKLSKDTTLTHGLMDETVRHRALIYLSLLSSQNCKCANWFYKTLLRTEWLESYIIKRSCKDENIQSELLLLFTMALYHPAFSFDHKTYLSEMLTHLLDQKESVKKHITPKPFPGYPPGFGYPNNTLKTLTPQDASNVPVKTVSPISPGDATVIQHPPGLPAHPTGAPVEFFHLWARPGFAGPISGAPEIAPFPHQPISPLVSQPASPSQSRASSPHRTFPLRAPHLMPMGHVLEVLPPHTAPTLPIDPLCQSSLPPFCAEIKSADVDVNHQSDDKVPPEQPWTNSVMVPVDLKPPNGYRLSTYNKVPQQPQQQQQPQQYFISQMQALNLDGENSLHRSNSSSSSNSSVNHSPPETPVATAAVPYHGPGRGEGKMRVNGVPPNFVAPNMNAPPPPPPPALPCDPTSPPPLSNCSSVPYSNYPPHATLAAIPNRSMFQYSQAYRPPFPYQPTENVVYSYSCPYMPSFVFSSAPSQAPSRNLNCYNCGATGHSGTECTGRSIEEITQNKGFALEYNSPLPETDK